MEWVKIPKEIQVGGSRIEVKRVEICDNNALGTVSIAAGVIQIANKFSGDKLQSDGSKINTFYHELTHSILQTMGREDLSDDEKFVCCFAGFLTEAMHNASFKEESKKQG